MRQKPFSRAMPRFTIRKVPGKVRFFHHLLEFVMIGPATEAPLARPDPYAHPEGADESAFSPPPSRIRYDRTRHRGTSRQAMPRFTIRKVPTKVPFLHHLLEFVMIGPATEAPLARPDTYAHPEGADQSDVDPSPSGFRCRIFCILSKIICTYVKYTLHLHK